ncbi:hypothetical protein NC653_002307 [Populus alba x Populus x berolinensis]|uniref:Uncharacterized protein n=1 Tax=Populus alba x Populus x berolinensis TaxID=444605 RepID=A0AAD6RNT9_9ROSI|nr:hypothetical protein NC653_002307 [Populus alba x Populus x berolinensis]
MCKAVWIPPPSSTIHIEAYTVTSYTIMCSIFYHTKKLISQPSNRKRTTHSQILITCSTSHPIHWERH